jgi:hypothetical protein
MVARASCSYGSVLSRPPRNLAGGLTRTWTPRSPARPGVSWCVTSANQPIAVETARSPIFPCKSTPSGGGSTLVHQK